VPGRYRDIALREGFFDGSEHECPLTIRYSVIACPDAHEDARLYVKLLKSKVETECQIAFLN